MYVKPISSGGVWELNKTGSMTAVDADDTATTVVAQPTQSFSDAVGGHVGWQVGYGDHARMCGSSLKQKKEIEIIV